MGSNPNAPANRLDRGNQYPSGYRASTHQEMAKRWKDSSGNWLDEQGSVIPRDELTYDHAPPVVDHWNSSGYNSSRAARNDYYNDPDNLVPMGRGPNFSAGGSMTARYRQDTGSNYSS